MKKAAPKTKKAKTSKSATKSAAKSPIYLRYEFSDETGRPEGGDIFNYTSMAGLKKLVGEVIDVAQNDGVSVSLSIGEGTPFFNFLKNNGLSQKEIEKEMVDPSVDPFSNKEKASPSKATKTKKKASRSSKSTS